MPYISTEQVREKRQLLKKQFPDFKFSITKDNHSSINVAILEAPFNMLSGEGTTHEQINHFHIEEHYKDTPLIKNTLLKIYSILQKGNYTESEDGDYGSIPSFYVHMSVGKWDKPFKLIGTTVKRGIRKCVICGNTFEGFGHNAEPVAKGMCCHWCNSTVIFQRLKLDEALIPIDKQQIMEEIDGKCKV